MKRTVLYLIIILLSITASCTLRNQWAEEVSWDFLDFSNLPDQYDYPDASAIVLYDKGEMDVISRASKAETVYERHRIVKILKPSGSNLANVSIPYGSSSRVIDIQARTISKDGIITIVKPENIFDINLYPRFVFFSDQRARIFTFPAVSKDCVLEYRYTVIIRGSMVTPSWSFQERIPVLHSQFRLIIPTSWDLEYRVYGRVMEPDVQKSPQANTSTYLWNARSIPALVEEFAMPPMREIGIWLSIGPPGVEEWADVSSWYYELSSPKEKANESIRQQVHELTNGLEDDSEKLQAIYNWVRNNVRYIAVSIGIGGYQPHDASEIFINRYGDCKDMTTLLCTMADQAGIKAHQVLISTHQNGDPDTSIASPHHFNHVIAYAPGLDENGIWMDATAKGAPFGVLPWYDQNLTVLVVSDDGGFEFRKTPQTSARSNGFNIDWHVDLGRKGQAEVEGKTTYFGEPAHDFRKDLQFMNQDQRLSWMRRYISEGSPGGVLDTFKIFGEQQLEDSLHIHYKFKSESFAMRHSDIIIIRPSEVFRMELPRVVLSEERNNPLQFRYGLQCSAELMVTFPENWETNFLSRSDSVSSDFGNAYWQWEPHDSYLKCESGYLLNGGEISVEKYGDFRKFLRKVHRSDIKEITLKRSVFY